MFNVIVHWQVCLKVNNIMASKKKKSQKQKTATGTGTAGKSIQKRKKAVSRRNDRWASAAAPLPSLVVRRPAPVISSKHTTYFEIVENTEKKKKLEFQVGGIRTVLSSSILSSSDARCRYAFHHVRYQTNKS